MKVKKEYGLVGGNHSGSKIKLLKDALRLDCRGFFNRIFSFKIRTDLIFCFFFIKEKEM
jgi:hypothetical protein